MLKLSPLWLCTNSIPTEDPFLAMDLAKELGFHLVELSSIDHVCEQIAPEKISDAYVDEIKAALDARGLRCIALSGHSLLTDDSGYARFLKKLEFAGKIGATRINTLCGPKDDYEIFLRRAGEILKIAERYGIRINFESYGDIVNDAEHTVDVFRKINHPLLGYNYDPGNLHRFFRGELDMVRDVGFAFPYLNCIHIKDGQIASGYLTHTAIGQGEIDFPGIFSAIEEHTEEIAAGIEVATLFRVRLSDFYIEHVPVGLDATKEALGASVAYLKQHALFEL